MKLLCGCVAFVLRARSKPGILNQGHGHQNCFREFSNCVWAVLKFQFATLQGISKWSPPFSLWPQYPSRLSASWVSHPDPLPLSLRRYLFNTTGHSACDWVQACRTPRRPRHGFVHPPNFPSCSGQPSPCFRCCVCSKGENSTVLLLSCKKKEPFNCLCSKSDPAFQASSLSLQAAVSETLRPTRLLAFPERIMVLTPRFLWE